MQIIHFRQSWKTMHGVQAVAVEEKEGCNTCEWRYWCSGDALCSPIGSQEGAISNLLTALFTRRSSLEALRLEALRLLSTFRQSHYSIKESYMEEPSTPHAWPRSENA